MTFEAENDNDPFEVAEPEPQAGVQESAKEEPAEAAAVVEKAPTLTPESIAAAFKAMEQEKSKAVPVAKPKQLTPEEFDAQFKVYKPAQDLYTRMSSTDPIVQQKAFLEHRDGMITQATTMAYHLADQLIQQKLAPILEKLNSVESTTADVARERSRGEFFKSYPEFEGYEDVLSAVSAQLNSQGFKPASSKEAYEKIAQTAGKLLDRLNPAWKDSAPAQLKQKPTTQTRMVATSRGGSGGSGGGKATNTNTNNSGVDVFDD